MTLKSDARFKEKLTCGFKYDINDLVNFHPTTLKSTNFTSMGYFCPKYMRFGLKKYRGVIIHHTEQRCKIWIKLDLVVSKMARGIGWTLIRVLKVLKNCTLMGSFCPKYVSVGKFQRNSVSWYWRVMINLKENWHAA